MSKPLFVALVLAEILSASSLCQAQSLKVDNPAPLSAGVNKGTIDSFVGDHFWYFIAQPGHFTIEFSAGNPEEGFSVGGKCSAGAAFAPNKPGSTLTYKENGGRTVFQGSCTQPSKVVVMVEPKSSPLVRQTTPYTIAVNGSASFGGTPSAVATAASTPSVVGVYNFKLNDFGAAKFQTDGTVVTTSGDTGKWVLFDAPTRSYVLTIRDQKLSLTFEPGRGFIDSNNGNLILEAKPIQ